MRLLVHGIHIGLTWPIRLVHTCHHPVITYPPLESRYSCNHYPTRKIHPLIITVRYISDYELVALLRTYNSPLILSIDGSFTPSTLPHIYPPHQPQHPTVAIATASVMVTVNNNSHPFQSWTEIPTIPLLSRVQPLPAAYGTNNVTNNTVELLARILAYELIPANMPAVIIYDSAVVHSQYLALMTNTCTNRQRTRTVFPAISRILAQRLATTQLANNHPRAPPASTPKHLPTGPQTLHDTITAQIKRFFPSGKQSNPTKHLITIGPHLFVKIKSHQLRSNGVPKYPVQPQPCYALVHSNHWVDKTYELPAADSHAPYPHNRGLDPFRTFLVILLHEYDDNTRCASVYSGPPPDGEPYDHTTLDPRAYRSITTNTSPWHHLKPDLTEISPEFYAYSHGLVSTLPPANYSRATMNVIEYIYIRILPRTAHITKTVFSVPSYNISSVPTKTHFHDHGLRRIS